MVSNPTLEAHPTTLRLLLHPSPPAPSLCPLSSILVRFLLLGCRSQEKSRQDLLLPLFQINIRGMASPESPGLGQRAGMGAQAS